MDNYKEYKKQIRRAIRKEILFNIPIYLTYCIVTFIFILILMNDLSFLSIIKLLLYSLLITLLVLATNYAIPALNDKENKLINAPLNSFNTNRVVVRNKKALFSKNRKDVIIFHINDSKCKTNTFTLNHPESKLIILLEYFFKDRVEYISDD